MAAAAAARSWVSGWASLCELLRLRVFWRALWCSCCLLLISKQWGDLDQVLPAFLERNYGEAVPIFRIHSINTWICMLGPSLAAALTSELEAWSVMLPGLWIMALSPLPLVLAPGVAAAALWVGLMSLGEVIWSPRQSAWVAGLAPDGREGVFLALLSLKSLITTIPSTALNGYLNSAFVPNCPQCRDSHGHFCAVPRALAPEAVAPEAVAPGGRLQRGLGPGGLGPAARLACSSEAEACVGPGFAEAVSAANLTALRCPESCAACPGWAGDGRTLWLIVLLTSLLSPVMVALTLNFLRGREATTAPAAAPAAAPAVAPAAALAVAPADLARDVRLRGLTPLRLTRPLSGTSTGT